MAEVESTEIEWAMLADYALIDTTGKLSIIGVFNRLWAPSFPTLHPLLFVVAAWRGAPHAVLAVELRLWGPSKDLVLTGEQRVELGPDGRSSGVFRLSPLPMASPGEYIVELMADAVSVAHLALTIEQSEQQ